jgi:hypothetical protein
VPFQQDLRIGRTKCRTCGKRNPPWGHVNTFTEAQLTHLFPNERIISRSFIGECSGATNPISTVLMDLAGNPWGTYDQEEPCIYCGVALAQPKNRRLWQKVCSGLAVRIDILQAHWTRPHANWIHLELEKSSRRA